MVAGISWAVLTFSSSVTRSKQETMILSPQTHGSPGSSSSPWKPSVSGEQAIRVTRPSGVMRAMGVGREVGHVDVAVGIDGHAVGGLQVGRITGPLAVLLHRAVGVEGDFVHHPVAEVADVEVAVVVEHDAVHAVLALGVLGDKGEEDVGIGQGVGAMDALGVPGGSGRHSS